MMTKQEIQEHAAESARHRVRGLLKKEIENCKLIVEGEKNEKLKIWMDEKEKQFNQILKLLTI